MADPKIKYDIEAHVSGQGDIGQLASSVEKLAGTLDGDLKASALASAAALRELAQKDQAIANFVSLKREAGAAADGLRQAQNAAQTLGAQLAATENPTRSQTGALQKLRDAVRDAKTEVIANSAALSQARGGLAQYGVSTDNLSQSQRNIKTAISAARTEVDAIVLSNAKATAAAQTAADQQNKIAAAVAASNARAVEMAKSAAASREQLAQRSLAAERQRQQFVDQYQLKEELGQQALLARSREIAAQYPRLATAAQAAGQQQVQANKQVGSGLDSLKGQLNSLRNIAVAALGGSYVGSMVKDVAATADAYNNLQARIRLVTGEGTAFATAFEGIAAVSQRTSSSLESTGNLFAKLAESGKAMGVGQAEALKLTETVNQAIQLSGATAQASDASIVQLIQGLQSGVLRGDEFNSVMEQSPRLAKALADGLGTTTGELRKMAEAGQLSSETVIKALQGQSDAVASEFSKLPPTVGRALQNLSTSWTLYVGETDKATGASRAAATVISGLASHLKTIADYLIDAGQAAAAFAALRLAQHFAGIATSATASATAVTANATAITAAGAAGTTAAAGIGRFAAVLSTLRTFTLVGVVANFKDIGTWIGEGIAKLNGYKDKTLELAAADKRATEEAEANTAARKRQAAETKEAADRTFGLTKEGSALVAKFDEMRTKGDSASDAIGKIGKDFDLSNIPGIRDAASVLDKLAADGKLSATEFHAAWATALKGQDLAVFETQARAAFAGTAREAERLAQMLDASLRESIKRTGLDFDVISGGMGKASRSAINDTEAMITGFDRLKAMGVDTAQALTASIGKGINTADSQKAIEAVKLQIESLRTKLGDKLTDGLLDQAKQKANELKDALDKATPGINSLREAYAQLGLKTSEELAKIASTNKSAWEEIRKDGTASAETLKSAFTTYANAAIAASGDVGSSQRAATDAALKTEAAMKGLSATFDANGKLVVQTQAEAKAAIDKTTGALGGQKNAVDDVTSALERQNAAQERANAAKEKAIELENKRLNRDKEGYSLNTAGQRVAMQGESERSVFESAKSQGLSEAQALQIAGQFIQNGQQVGGPDMFAAKQGATWFTEVQKAIDKLVLDNAAKTATTGKPDSTPSQNQPFAPGQSPSNTVNVRITLPNGSVQTVPTTQDGSAALIAALQAAKLSAGM